MEIIFEQCPSCNTHACAFAVIDGKTVCPMCAPVPDKTPHDYTPIQIGGVVKRELSEPPGFVIPRALWNSLKTPNLISGACCADAGDCGHECGIG